MSAERTDQRIRFSHCRTLSTRISPGKFINNHVEKPTIIAPNPSEKPSQTWPEPLFSLEYFSYGMEYI